MDWYTTFSFANFFGNVCGRTISKEHFTQLNPAYQNQVPDNLSTIYASKHWHSMFLYPNKGLKLSFSTSYYCAPSSKCSRRINLVFLETSTLKVQDYPSRDNGYVTEMDKFIRPADLLREDKRTSTSFEIYRRRRLWSSVWHFSYKETIRHTRSPRPIKRPQKWSFCEVLGYRFPMGNRKFSDHLGGSWTTSSLSITPPHPLHMHALHGPTVRIIMDSLYREPSAKRSNIDDIFFIDSTLLSMRILASIIHRRQPATKITNNK